MFDGESWGAMQWNIVPGLSLDRQHFTQINGITIDIYSSKTVLSPVLFIFLFPVVVYKEITFSFS